MSKVLGGPIPKAKTSIPVAKFSAVAEVKTPRPTSGLVVVKVGPQPRSIEIVMPVDCKDGMELQRRFSRRLTYSVFCRECRKCDGSFESHMTVSASLDSAFNSLVDETLANFFRSCGYEMEQKAHCFTVVHVYRK